MSGPIWLIIFLDVGIHQFPFLTNSSLQCAEKELWTIFIYIIWSLTGEQCDCGLLCCSCVCHSVSMFIDNRLVPTDGNENVEHLLEISLFMVIGLFNFYVGRAVWY